MIVLPLLVALSTSSALAQTSAARAADCQRWGQCRQLATEAINAGEFEHAHDLAWRAVQLGPRGNPDLMYLLARAQSLSGRPHDALVMLERLMDAGFKPDLSDQAFHAVRSLREWPQLEARLTGASEPPTDPVAGASRITRTPDSRPDSADPARTAAAPSGATQTVPTTRSTPAAKIEEAVRLPAGTLSPSGLAYDRASARFVVADRQRKKLVIIDERSHHVVDLVRASSAGFYDITGFEIDPRQGDLWVVSGQSDGEPEKRATALHKLQLVSGRPLFTVRVPDNLLPARLDDVAISSRGAVFVLDTAGKRILRLQASPRTFVVVATLATADHPVSLAATDDETVYVAHASGILRVDVATGMETPVREGAGVQLSGFERIRAEDGRLFGIQQTEGGGRRAVAVTLTGGRARSLTVLAANLDLKDPSAAALSADSLYVLTRTDAGPAGDELVVERVRLP